MQETKFKQTEVGRIPQDWEVRALGDIGVTYSGLTGKSKQDFIKGSSCYITFLNVLNNPILKPELFESVQVDIDERQNRAHKGDLFFNISSETPEEVGICALLDKEIANLYLNSFCFGYRLRNQNVAPLFLSYFFRSKEGRQLMTIAAQGVTRYNLSKSTFNKIRLALPPLAEQERIASALTAADNLIASLDKQIAKTRNLKQATMQHLLSSLPIHSPLKPLGEVGVTYSGLTGKCKQDFIKGSSCYITFLNVLNNPILKPELFESVHVDIDEKQNRAHKGDLFFNTSSETPEEVGVCALLNVAVDNLYLNSFCFGYRLTNKNVSPLYLSYFFRSKEGRQLMTAAAQGVTRYNLSKSTFNKMQIPIPPIEEQERIASILTAMDNQIAALEKKRSKYEMVKQGMMQQLLTGTIRLI